MPFNLSYFSALIYTLSNLTLNNNRASISKCQSYFPLQTIYDLFTLLKDQYNVKKSLMLLYSNVYCDSDSWKDLDESDRLITNKLSEAILEDVKKCSKILSTKASDVGKGLTKA